MVSYLDTFLALHDDYIEAYNKQYEEGKIGNGKNFDPDSNTEGFDFELYPKSHPVLRHKNFIMTMSRVRRVLQVFYYWLTYRTVDFIIDEVYKDK
jgi:hypothetical protein